MRINITHIHHAKPVDIVLSLVGISCSSRAIVLKADREIQHCQQQSKNQNSRAVLTFIYLFLPFHSFES